MEYVYGEDLRQLIRKVGRLSPGQAIGIARQVCAGLEEAHNQGHGIATSTWSLSGITLRSKIYSGRRDDTLDDKTFSS